MDDISSNYGYFFLILSCIITIYFLWKNLTKPENQPIRGITGSKWSNIGWLYSIILTMESVLLVLISNFSDTIIKFRIIQTPFANVIDIILICHIFLGLFAIISKVRMQTTGDRSGKLVVPKDGIFSTIFILLFLPEYGQYVGYILSGVILFFYILLGASIALVIIALIPIILTKKLFQIAPAY